MLQESEPQFNQTDDKEQQNGANLPPGVLQLPRKNRFLPVINAPNPTFESAESTKRPTKSRREERYDAVQNRERLLETASKLFAEHGVAAVTMSEIAEAAGVGKGTLYRRFAHKGQLCQALMDANTRRFQNDVLGGFGEKGQQATPLGRLWLFVERMLEFTEENAELLEAAFEANIDRGGTVFYSQPSYDWLRMTLRQMLQEAVAAGECKRGLDLDYLADALLAPFQVGLYLHQRQVRGYSVERIREGFRQLLGGVLA